MKFKTILVSICLIMAAASASFANGENDKCKAAAAPVVKITGDETEATCTRTVSVNNGPPVTATVRCNCVKAVACEIATVVAAKEANKLITD